MSRRRRERLRTIPDGDDTVNKRLVVAARNTDTVENPRQVVRDETVSGPLREDSNAQLHKNNVSKCTSDQKGRRTMILMRLRFPGERNKSIHLILEASASRERASLISLYSNATNG